MSFQYRNSYRTRLLQVSLAYQHRIVCAFACQLQLWPETPTACRVSLPNVFLLPPNCRWRYQGLHTCSSYRLFGALQECLANPLDLLFCCCWSSRSFCSAQAALKFSNFFFQVQICFALDDFLENFLTNARCTVLFEFVRAYFITQNAFSLLVNTI